MTELTTSQRLRVAAVAGGPVVITLTPEQARNIAYVLENAPRISEALLAMRISREREERNNARSVIMIMVASMFAIASWGIVP